MRRLAASRDSRAQGAAAPGRAGACVQDVRQDGDTADALGGADASSDGGRQILHDSHSIVPRMDDPDMIAAACAGTNPATRTTVVHFNFKGLEFAHPTRMVRPRPVCRARSRVPPPPA